MKAPPITENQFLNQVLAVARLTGWRSCHFRPAMVTKRGEFVYRTPVQGDVGFPDIVLVKNGKILFLECKSAKGQLSPEQKEWLKELNACQTTAMTVRPGDFDTLVELLKDNEKEKDA